MRLTTGVILLLALSVKIQASQYEGRIISIRNGLVRLNETKLRKTFDLTFKDADASTSVSRLKINDFVSFEGVKNLTKAFIRVDSVNYVGLSLLMGAWTGDDKYCYKFSSFTELVIYPKAGQCTGQAVGPATPRQFAYTVNSADDENTWIMLLSDATARYAADLKVVNAKHIELSLYDVNSGNILRLIKLTK